MPPTSTATSTTSSSHRQDYERDGYVIVRGLFPAEQMLAWKQTLRQALEAERYDEPSGVRVWLGDALPQPAMAAMTAAPLATVVQDLIGPDVEYLSAKAVFKDGKTRFGSPWHQDCFYWEGATKLSVWIALDDATPDNGCLTVAPGTHHRLFDRQDVKGGSFVKRIDEADLEGQSIVSAQASRGDAIFFHDRLVHGSHPNRVGGDRWSLIATYRSGAVRDDSTRWSEPLLVSGSSVNGAHPPNMPSAKPR